MNNKKIMKITKLKKDYKNMEELEKHIVEYIKYYNNRKLMTN